MNDGRKRPFFVRLSPYFSVYGRLRPCLFDLGSDDDDDDLKSNNMYNFSLVDDVKSLSSIKL